MAAPTGYIGAFRCLGLRANLACNPRRFAALYWRSTWFPEAPRIERPRVKSAARLKQFVSPFAFRREA
jgi:hypothetical protein